MKICLHAYFIEGCFLGRIFKASHYYYGYDDAKEYAKKRLKQFSLEFPKVSFSLKEKTFSSEEELCNC